MKTFSKESQRARANIAILEKEIVTQENINNEYRSKLGALNFDFETMMKHLGSSQDKVDAKLARIEERVVEVAKEQRELFCLMMLSKNTTLDHGEMLERVNLLENKELRELIELRFFPNTRKEKSEKREADQKLNEQFTDLNINSILVALEKIHEKLQPL